MYIKNTLKIIGLAISLVLPLAGTASAQDFQIIVNDSNPASTLRADFVSRLMLKKTTTWDHGEKVIPVDHTDRSVTRAAFTKKVLRKSISSIKAYWQQQIFSGRGVPPAELDSDAAVIAFVGRNPGAIGYVSKSAAINGVKSVRLQN